MDNKTMALLVTGLRTIQTVLGGFADALERIAAMDEAAPEVTAQIPQNTPPSIDALPQPEEPAYTLDDVRIALSTKAAMGNVQKNAVRALLDRYGVGRVSELKDRPEMFAPIIKEAEAIGNG